MKQSMIIILGGALASLLVIPQMASLFAQNKRAGDGELRERDEIRQTFRLTPGTHVEVSSIRGTVEIETADTEVAEVHIVRSAERRADLEKFKVTVENKPQGLIIRGEQNQRTSGSGFDADVHHHVMLKLPRRVDLSVQSVSGAVKVGDVGGQLMVNSVSGSLSIGVVDGQVQVGSVSGGVSIGQANRQAEIKSVSGNLSIGQAIGSLNVMSVSGTLSAGISQLGQRGVHISSVSGEVELRFKDELNAQLSTDNISGELSLEVPNVNVQSRPNASALRALIGKGGPPISINSVSKGVRLVKS